MSERFTRLELLEHLRSRLIEVYQEFKIQFDTTNNQIPQNALESTMILERAIYDVQLAIKVESLKDLQETFNMNQLLMSLKLHDITETVDHIVDANGLEVPDADDDDYEDWDDDIEDEVEEKVIEVLSELQKLSEALKKVLDK